jgi:hypothetical protein
MPKNASTDILKRWQAMDAALSGEGLHAPTFARQFRVSEKTVRRDRAAFEALGRTMVKAFLHAQCVNERGEPALPPVGDRSYDLWVWWYEDGVAPLFTANRRDPNPHDPDV